MTARIRSISLILIAALLIGQWIDAGHDHSSESANDQICQFCLHFSQSGSALPVSGFTISPPPADFAFSPVSRCRTIALRYYRPGPRAPPGIQIV